MDRGTKFELAVADILRAKGYSVEHNVNMTGRSGAVHQIDVLAEYQCPLHRDTVIVETKDHGSNISKDTVMKLASIQQDLSVGNAILATTSDFTIGRARLPRSTKTSTCGTGAGSRSCSRAMARKLVRQSSETQSSSAPPSKETLSPKAPPCLPRGDLPGGCSDVAGRQRLCAVSGKCRTHTTR